MLDKIYSPGTYVSCEFEGENVTSNQIMCIWLQTHKLRGQTGKHILVYGASSLNNFTGELYMIEGQKDYKMDMHYYTHQENTVLNCLKQTYMKEIIEQLYGLNLYETCAEF